MCNCPHCETKHRKFQAAVLAKTDLPIIHERYHRISSIHAAITHLESFLSVADHNGLTALEHRIDTLKNELQNLVAANSMAVNTSDVQSGHLEKTPG